MFFFVGCMIIDAKYSFDLTILALVKTKVGLTELSRAYNIGLLSFLCIQKQIKIYLFSLSMYSIALLNNPNWLMV